MPERRLLIKEMWNEFNSFQPHRSAEQRQVVEMFFYAGVIAMWRFLEEVDATQEMIDQMSEEIRDFVLAMHKLATVGEAQYHA